MFLSICIPTYKRVDFLRATLDSIVPVMGAEVEVVICDNASADGTRELVEQYSNKFKNIIYHEWLENVGADRNYLEIVNRASGEYCWLLGSDDAIIPEVVPRLCNTLINSRCDVLVADRYDCDFQMRPVGVKHWFNTGEVIEFNLRSDEGLLACAQKATSIGALFSYLSSVVIRRAAWSSRVDYGLLIGTAYSHVGMILSGLREEGRSGKYLYLPIAIVYNREGNDSFRGKSVSNRYLLDIIGYKKVFSWVGVSVGVTQKVLEFLIFRDHFGEGAFSCFKGLCWIKAKSDSKDWIKLNQEWADLGISSSPLRMTRIMPKWFLLLVRKCAITLNYS